MIKSSPNGDNVHKIKGSSGFDIMAGGSGPVQKEISSDPNSGTRVIKIGREIFFAVSVGSMPLHNGSSSSVRTGSTLGPPRRNPTPISK